MTKIQREIRRKYRILRTAPETCPRRVLRPALPSTGRWPPKRRIGAFC